MTLVITIVIILITLAYIIYPFFSKSAVTPAEVRKTPAGSKPRDIDSEIERRVSEIRKKDKAVCPDCGASYKEGSRFCSQCGAELSDSINED